MKQITITGGAGFIGSNVSSYYLDKGCRVVIYDSLERKGCLTNVEWLRRNPNAQNLEVLIGDIRLPTRALQQAIEASDALFHMAGQVAVTTSVKDPVQDFEVNALGAFKLLELVRNSSRKQPVFVYASTNKVYGGMENVEIREYKDRFGYADLPKASQRTVYWTFIRPTAVPKEQRTSMCAIMRGSMVCRLWFFAKAAFMAIASLELRIRDGWRGSS